MTAQETQGAPSIEHLCLLGGVSRAGFYRFGEVREPKRTETDLRDKIQKIALENRFYGYRRHLHLSLMRAIVIATIASSGAFMSRIGRFVVPDLPHHVTQRGKPAREGLR